MSCDRPTGRAETAAIARVLRQREGPLQADLFAPRPRRHDEALLLRRLGEAVTPGRVHGLTPAEIKRLMTPLPRITAFD